MVGSKKIALITGITGQDGAYLAEFLLNKGYDSSRKIIIAVDPRYYRPTEVETLLCDASKARKKLGWTPKIDFNALVSEMVREDLSLAQRDELTKKHGYKTLNYNE